MAKRVKKIDSKEVGLEIGLIIFKFFLKTEYLHYGYFTKDLNNDIHDLPKAQEKYAELLISFIPEGVKTILDVGGGSGKFAQKLHESGYEVTMVSPSKVLNKYAENLLGEAVDVHTKKFQDLELDKKYDMVLFSESFQYIPMEESLSRAKQHLHPNGHVLISDFFKTDPEGKSLLGGGHKFHEWEEIIAKHPEYQLLKEQDITAETSVTIDIVKTFTESVIEPTWRLLFALGEDRFPKIMKLVKWKFKKKFAKMENKHFTGQRNGANFRKYKKYMVYLYQVKE
jgi:2-polyprenyl-3-methyl-5-hydroxy-6-metoxy-1,4-benzoquinol methylase